MDPLFEIKLERSILRITGRPASGRGAGGKRPSYVKAQFQVEAVRRSIPPGWRCGAGYTVLLSFSPRERVLPEC
jgi:hypothetical protein